AVIIMQSSAEALNHLENYLRRGRRAAVLFSGGLDSSLLLAAAARVLGGLCAITLVGPHIVPGELAAAWGLARRLGVKHLVRSFDPLALPDFRENSRRRCYACKRAVIAQAWQVAREQGAEVLWDGTNLDDLGDFRPGLQAARELGVASPLLAAGLDKAAIRSLSRTLNLPIKPAQSCLATRFPYGATLTREDLGRVGQGEAWLRRRGFSHVRLRVPEAAAARLELDPEEWPAFLAPQVRRPFMAVLRRLGFSRFSLDLPK
ncbi:MAG: ATP-dependent sacrificial sulfur transferase LarE, partial [Desulfobaccales bacterium]